MRNNYQNNPIIFHPSISIMDAELKIQRKLNQLQKIHLHKLNNQIKESNSIPYLRNPENSDKGNFIEFI